MVTLSYAVLNATALCEIKNLGPVFIGVGVRVECADITATTTSAWMATVLGGAMHDGRGSAV